MKRLPSILILSIAALVAPDCGPPGAVKQPAASGAKEQHVREGVPLVELYTMSKCPYSAEAQQTMKKLLEELGDYIEFRQYFIVVRSEGGGVESLHGKEEVKGDAIQLCAAKHYGDDYKFMDLVACMAADPGAVPGNWESCAASCGIDPAKIRTCMEGFEGESLLLQSADKVNEKKIFAGPTLLVEGDMLIGAKGEEEMRNLICCGFPEGEIPPPCREAAQLCSGRTTIHVTAITDGRCKECAYYVPNVLERLMELFPKLEVEILDFSEEKARKMYDEVHGAYLPLFILDEHARREPGFEEIEQWTVQAHGWVLIKAGKVFHPLKEICKNGKDDDGDGAVDCADEDCTEKPGCRKEIPSRMDLFVMSWCPFGRQAENAMGEVLDHLGSGLDFNLYFIMEVYSPEELELLPPVYREGCSKMQDGNYYCTLHGYPELKENLLQACAREHYGKKNKYMDFVLCRNEDITDPEWETCAETHGMDAGKILQCAEGDEGLSLLREDALISGHMEATGSPTFFANNKEEMKVLDYTPEDIIVEFCKRNKDLKACKKKLPNPSKNDPAAEEPPKCGE